MLIGMSGVSMQRRTLLKQFGTAGAAAAGFSGVATATSGREFGVDPQDLGIDRQIDVADVEGAVPLAELLEPADLDGLPDDVDPWEAHLQIGQDVDSIEVQSDCCVTEFCCKHIAYCYCSCCWCQGCGGLR